MDVRVRGQGPADPFLAARDLLATERQLRRSVTVEIVADPDERTRVSHSTEGHRLTISQQAATSAMARELALHEFAHMHHSEQAHPSHTQSTEEAIYLALAGHSVEQRKLTHVYQIANHMKDIYADDVWLEVAPADKLVDFLESSLAAALADRPSDPPVWGSSAPDPATVEGPAGPPHPDGPGTPGEPRAPPARRSPASDPEITAVNAAFALALVERHGLVESDHRLYDLADVAAADAPTVDFETFRRRFRTLARDPDQSQYRKALVDVTRTYAGSTGQAAD